MPAQAKIKIGVIGASGYTGADLIRLAACHPNMELALLAANTHAGKALGEVFPHLGLIGAPALVKAEDADWSQCGAVFCGLPHGTAQDIIATLPESVKVIDMSADFRLRDTATYAKWYGREHAAAHLLKDAVYGLTEFYGDAIAKARLVACPGCYPTAALLALLPLVHGSSSTHRISSSTPSRASRAPAARSSRTSCSPRRARGFRPTPSRATGTHPRSSRKSPPPPASRFW